MKQIEFEVIEGLLRGIYEKVTALSTRKTSFNAVEFVQTILLALILWRVWK
jgi:hypothetical protein